MFNSHLTLFTKYFIENVRIISSSMIVIHVNSQQPDIFIYSNIFNLVDNKEYVESRFSLQNDLCRPCPKYKYHYISTLGYS